MDNSSANGFGAYIKFLRTKANISQRELAEQANLSTSEISKLENGERQKPSVKFLKCIAPVLNVSMQDLLYRAGYIDDNLESDSEFSEKKFTDSMGNTIDVPYLINSIYSVDKDLLPLLKMLIDRYNTDDLRIVKGLFKALTTDVMSVEEKNAILIILSKFLKVSV